MNILFLGATYAPPEDRRSTAVRRDSTRVDAMVAAGHAVRCVSLMQDTPSNAWWRRADMSGTDFANVVVSFGVSFDAAIVDYCWCPVSIAWLESTYLRHNARLVATMRRLEIPLWIPANRATDELLRAHAPRFVSWEQARDLPLLRAEDSVGLVGKDLRRNRSAHTGWFIL
jgi:hypothetical protein